MEVDCHVKIRDDNRCDILLNPWYHADLYHTRCTVIEDMAIDCQELVEQECVVEEIPRTRSAELEKRGKWSVDTGYIAGEGY